jgi:hypothetical protein
VNRKVAEGVVSSPAAQNILHTAVLISERIRQLYGNRAPTEDELDQVLAQIEAEHGLQPPHSPD